MDEHEWARSVDPRAMLNCLFGRDGPYSYAGKPFGEPCERKLDLFAEACAAVCDCKHIRTEHWREYVRQPNYGWDSDCKASAVAAHFICEIFGNPWRTVTIDQALRTPTVVAIARGIDGGEKCEECGGFGWIRVQRDYDIRDACKPCHGTGKTGFDPSGMPALHDALIEAGCEDEAILAHCREQERCRACLADWSVGIRTSVVCRGGCKRTGWIPSRHVRGCWVIDLILGL